MDEKELEELGVSLRAGFPNAAIGSSNKQLDLTRLLIKHPSATYLMQIDSDEWNDVGIFSGDIAVIDRAVDSGNTDTVVWWEGDQFVLSKKPKVPKDSETWGVVTSIIHQTRKP